jgi:GTP-binding protein HflX
MMRTDGLESLKAALRLREQVARPAVRIRLPLSDGARVAALYRMGEVLQRREVNGAYEVVVRLLPPDLDRLRKEGVEILQDFEPRRELA